MCVEAQKYKLRKLCPRISFVANLSFQKEPELGAVNSGTTIGGLPRMSTESRLGGNRAGLLDNAAPSRLTQNGLDDGLLNASW